MMKALIVLLVIVQSILAQPIPGDAGYGLHFSGTQQSYWGEVGGTNFFGTLGGSWSFDFWVKVDNPQSGSLFQPLVSHYAPGGQNNRYADFNIQVWPSGQLCFFMGNGQSTNGGYGILIFGTDPTDKLQPDTWYHVAITVEGSSSYPYTPVRASLYLDGDLIGSKLWNEGSNGVAAGATGARNLPSQRVTLTKFDNQDPGVQVTAATIDELRFWSYERTYDEINNDMNVHVDPETEGLEAYYRFETQNSVLADEEGAWDGSVQTYPGGETALVYEVTEVVFNTFATAQQTVPSVITLTATDPDGATDITYYISTLPEHGALYVVSATGAIGTKITAATLSSALPSDQVAYYATDANFLGWDYFDYFAKHVELSAEGARVFVNVTAAPGVPVPPPEVPSCDGIAGHVYDECGVCNGDGTTCTCVENQYRSYSLVELDRILVHYNIEYTLDLISTLNSTLDETLAALYENPNSPSINLGDAVDVIQQFNDQCLKTFVSDMDDFLSDLKTVA